jgi:hypothetical protein
MEGNLTVSSSPLAELCDVLGIAGADLAAVEGAERIAHTFQVAGAAAARLDRDRVRAFAEHYGDAASIELRTGELTEIIIAPEVTDAELDAFVHNAASGGPYEAVVRVDKGALVKRIAGPAPVRAVRVFLFAASLSRALARGITHFESDVWPQAPAPLVIAVLDTDINLDGAHLAILGGSSLTEAPARAATPAPDADFSAIRESRDRHVGWETRWVDGLTPWHFELAGACADSELLGLLHAQLVKLAVLFTCDRARAQHSAEPATRILAEYRGREHIAVIPVDQRSPLDAGLKELAAVLSAVDWCYRRHGQHGEPDWVSDRLPFLQTRVAEALEPRQSDERLAAFVNAMPYLLEGIEWHWKAFIEGKVGDYLDRVQELESIVTDTVSAFADRVAGLVKGLSDTMLAAIAALIGSFIAADFSPPFNATLFRIGVLTYGAYVLLFPGLIGLLASAAGLRGARTEFKARIRRFNETLYPAKVQEIVGDRVTRVQDSFYQWLTVVGVIYLVVAVLAVVAALKVPGLVK